MQLRLLGEFELSGPDGPIALPRGSARVLAYLGLHRAPVRRAVLATTLWPEVEPGRAMGNLRSAVWRLPPTARPSMRRHDDGLSLGTGVECDLDAIEIQTQQRCPRLAPLSSTGLCADLLPGWYDDWVLLERERLSLWRAELFEATSLRRNAEGSLSDAVFYALASIALEPYRESAHRALLAAHATQGNHAEMLIHYRSLSRLLAEEIGVPPAAETIGILHSCGLHPGDAEEVSLDPWARS